MGGLEEKLNFAILHHHYVDVNGDFVYSSQFEVVVLCVFDIRQALHNLCFITILCP